jgi:hypothetical protein
MWKKIKEEKSKNYKIKTKNDKKKYKKSKSYEKSKNLKKNPNTKKNKKIL